MLQATALLTAMVGAMLILASVLRLGFVANFISEPVLVGFKAGIAVVIIVDQIPKVLGIHFPKGSFLHNVGAIVRGLSDASIPTLAVGLLTMAGLVAIERLKPRWPAPLIVIAAAIAGVGLFGWQRHGIELVGAIPTGLPAFTVPDLGAGGSAVARRPRHRAHELHRDGRRRARVREERRALAAAQCRAVRDRDGECGRAHSWGRCPPAAARPRRPSTA